VPEADLLVFVHIEKCAGTAINYWLYSSHRYGNLYVKGANVPMTSMRWDDVRPDDLIDTRMRSIGSHHFRTFPPVVCGRRMRYFTVLRDPIDRWISFVRYFNLLERDERGELQSLRDYADAMLARPPADDLRLINGQTNFIAEHEWYRQHRDDALAIDWSREPDLFARYLRERLAFAKHTLDGFGLVGVVERLDEVVGLLRVRGIQWDIPLLPITTLNPTHVTERPPVDRAWITPADSVGRRLLDAFAEDVELHRYAGERMDAAIAALAAMSSSPSKSER